MDPDVQGARERWQRGEWSCFEVAESIFRQWTDRHVDDADASGEDINAHGADDVAVFAEAVAACAAQVAVWVGRLALLRVGR